VEHDAHELAASVFDAIGEVVKQAGSDAARIRAAGLSTQRSSVVCWDRHTGEPLTPVISWQDTRARSFMAGLRPASEWIHRKTGLFPSAHYGASKLAWCLKNVDGLRAKARDGRLCMGPVASYLAWKLTSERSFLADPVNASRTLLWNIYSCDWDDEIREIFAVPAESLPRCVTSDYAFGTMDLGGQVVPLKVVTGDQAAALFASGPLVPDQVYVNMGTGAFITRSTGEVLFSARRLLSGVAHATEDASTYLLEGTVNGAGSALQWAAAELPLPGIEKKLPGLLDRAGELPLFLNGVSGLGSPFWIPSFGSGFVDGGDVEQKAAAVAESIVFLLYANLREMIKTAAAPESIVITGGLSSLDGLCQRLADLARVPVIRPEVVEATLLGTGFLVAGQPGNWLRPKSFSFEPMARPALVERYGRWEDAMLSRMRSD
jgi:glycerol kinase